MKPAGAQPRKNQASILACGQRSGAACAMGGRLVMALLSLMLAGAAIAKTDLRVAVQEDSAPKFVLGSDPSAGVVEGICPDILRAIEHHDPSLRFLFEARAQPLRRILLRMERGEVDANCLVDNAERRARFQSIGVTLFSFDYHLIARVGDPVQISSWDDVRRLGAQGRILTVSGTGVMERLLKIKGLTVDDSGKSANSNLRKLVNGRGRFFYYRTHDWEGQVRAAVVAGQVRILPTPMEAVSLQLMLGRHVERGVVLRVERALRQLEANGKLAQLRAKWKLGVARP